MSSTTPTDARGIWVAAGLLLLASLAGCPGDDSDEEPTPADGGEVGTDVPETSDVSEDGDAIPDPAGDEGPGRVLDVEAAREYRDLETEVSRANSGDVVVKHADFQTKVFEFDFQYLGQKLWESEWRHQTALYVPEERNASAPEGAFVIIPAGTRNPVPSVSAQEVFRTNYAASVAAAMGIPAMVVGKLPGPVNLKNAPGAWRGSAPGRCFVSGLPDERYAPCLLRILRETDDPQADPFRHLAYAWMRAVTAAIDAMRESGQMQWPNKEPPAWTPRRAVILADGALAVGARMAAAVDVRIDGVFGNADFARVSKLLGLMSRRWSSDYGWFENPAAFREWLATDAGRDWKKTVDPVEWTELVEGNAFVHARGTRDPRFPLGAGSLVAGALPDDSASVTAPGYGAGIGSADHLAAWYGFVAHVYLGKPWATVGLETQQSGAGVQVRATVSGGANVTGVVADWVKQQRQRDDTDFRDTVWQKSAMMSEGDAWTAEVAPIVQNHAVFSRAQTKFQVSTILDDPKKWTIEPRWSSPVDVFSAN